MGGKCLTNSFSAIPTENDAIQSFFEKRGILIALTGLPASGKSTLVRELRQKLQKWPIQVKVYDTDLLRHDLFGHNFQPSHESSVRKTFYSEISEALQPNTVVIADDLNYFTSMRHRLMDICTEKSSGYFLIYMDTPLSTCLQRNQTRSDPLDPHIITRIADRFDTPGGKYAWDLPFYVLKSGLLPMGGEVADILSRLITEIISFSESVHRKTQGSANVSDPSDQIEQRTRAILHSLIRQTVENDEVKTLQQIDGSLLKLDGLSRDDPQYAAKLNQWRRKFKQWLGLHFKGDPNEITLALFMEFLSTNLH